MTSLQRSVSTINRKSGLKWGGVDADFLPSLKVESVPSLGRHREGSIHSIEIEVFQKFSNSLDFDANSRLYDA